MTLQQALRKPTTPGEVLQYEYLEPLNLKINDLAEVLNDWLVASPVSKRE